MATTTKPPAVITDNGRLAIDHLSYSSLRVFLQCPFKWFQIYVLRATRPPAWLLPAGRAGHKALEANNRSYITDGAYLTVNDVQEVAAEEYEQQMSFEEINWKGENKGHQKTVLIKQVSSYRKSDSPNVHPIQAEERWELTPNEQPWTVTGYIDVVAGEGDGEHIIDYKFTGRSTDAPLVSRLSSGLEFDPQPALYYYSRQSQGANVKRFSYHNLVRTKEPKTQEVDVIIPQQMIDQVPKWLDDTAAQIQWMLDTINGEPTQKNYGRFAPRPKLFPADKRFDCGAGCEYCDVCPLYGGKKLI